MARNGVQAERLVDVLTDVKRFGVFNGSPGEQASNTQAKKRRCRLVQQYTVTCWSCKISHGGSPTKSIYRYNGVIRKFVSREVRSDLFLLVTMSMHLSAAQCWFRQHDFHPLLILGNCSASKARTFVRCGCHVAARQPKNGKNSYVSVYLYRSVY